MKRSRKAAQAYKEPGSDLSDFDLSAEEDEKPQRNSAAQSSKRAKPQKATQPSTVKKNSPED